MTLHQATNKSYNIPATAIELIRVDGAYWRTDLGSYGVECSIHYIAGKTGITQPERVWWDPGSTNGSGRVYVYTEIHGVRIGSPGALTSSEDDLGYALLSAMDSPGDLEEVILCIADDEYDYDCECEECTRDRY